MFCARRDGRRVSYGFRDNGVDRVDPILRARHRFSGARSAQALADLNRATLFWTQTPAKTHQHLSVSHCSHTGDWLSQSLTKNTARLSFTVHCRYIPPIAHEVSHIILTSSGHLPGSQRL